MQYWLVLHQKPDTILATKVEASRLELQTMFVNAQRILSTNSKILKEQDLNII